MGLNYSFQAIFKGAQINDLLSGLCPLLVTRDRQRIERSLPWKPERTAAGWHPVQERIYEVQQGIEGVRDPAIDGEGQPSYSYHLSLGLEATGNLRRLAKRYGFLSSQTRASSQATVDIGSVWTTVDVGHEWGVLALTASGTSMSCLFQESAEIQEAIVQALSKSCTAVLLDDDEQEPENVTLLFPFRRTLRLEGREETALSYKYAMGDGYEYWVYGGSDPDRYAALVISQLQG